jgi:TfoX/Sxy family transcriptional regulator of competence genes
MAYDEGLEARIDEITDGWENYEKKKMFGGICYLRSGNMAFGIWKDYLIVRCGRDRHTECLRQEHTKAFDVTGKPMSGWVMVAPEGVEEDSELMKWIGTGDEYSASLPSKKLTLKGR